MKHFLFLILFIFCFAFQSKANDPYEHVKARVVGYTLFITGKFEGMYNLDMEANIAFYQSEYADDKTFLWSIWDLNGKVPVWTPEIKISYNLADWILNKKMEKMYLDFAYVLQGVDYTRELWIYVNDKNQITLKWKTN
jgi:hypothetical protein